MARHRYEFRWKDSPDSAGEVIATSLRQALHRLGLKTGSPKSVKARYDSGAIHLHRVVLMDPAVFKSELVQLETGA